MDSAATSFAGVEPIVERWLRNSQPDTASTTTTTAAASTKKLVKKFSISTTTSSTSTSTNTNTNNNSADQLFQFFVEMSPALGHPFPLRRQVVRILSPSNEENGGGRDGFVEEITSEGESVMTVKLQQICVHLAALFVNRTGALLSRSFAAGSYLQDVELTRPARDLDRAAFLIGSKAVLDKFTDQLRHMMAQEVLRPKPSSVGSNTPKNPVAVYEEKVARLCDVIKACKPLTALVCQLLVGSDVPHTTGAAGEVRECVRTAVLEQLSDSMKRFVAAHLQPGEAPAERAAKRDDEAAAVVHPHEYSQQRLSAAARLLRCFFDFEETLAENEHFNFAAEWRSNSAAKTGVLKDTTGHLLTGVAEAGATASWCHSWSDSLGAVAAPLADSVSGALVALAEEPMHEARVFIASNSPALLGVMDAATLFPGAREPPKAVFTCVGAALERVLDFAVYAKLGGKQTGRPLSKLLFGFIDAVNKVMRDVKMLLAEITELLPAKANEDYAATLMATCQAVARTLSTCGRELSKHQDQQQQPPFVSAQQKFTWMARQVKQQIIQHQRSYVATSVLYEPEEHLKGSKSLLGKATKCSLEVRCWHLHLLQLREQLTAAVARADAMDILSEVLVESCRVFSDRFCNLATWGDAAAATADMALVLHVAHRLSWGLHAFEELVNPCRLRLSFNAPFTDEHKISRACGEIHAAHALTSTPLRQLTASLHQLPATKHTLNSRLWLHDVDPCAYPPGWSGKVASLSNEQLVYCGLRRLSAGTAGRFSLVQRLLSLRNFWLARRLIAGEIPLLNCGTADVEEAVYRCFQRDSRALSALLVAAAKSSCKLTDKRFIKLSYLKLDDKIRQPWQRVVHQLLVPEVQRAVQVVCSVVQSGVWSAETEDHLQQIPEDVQAVVRRGPADTDDLVFCCTRLLLKMLRSAACFLSAEACHVMACFQRELEALGATVPFGSFGACALVQAAHSVLTNAQMLARLSPCQPGGDECGEVYAAVADRLRETGGGDGLDEDFGVFVSEASALFEAEAIFDDADEDVGVVDSPYDAEAFAGDEEISATRFLGDLLVDNCQAICKQLLAEIVDAGEMMCVRAYVCLG